MSLLLLGSACSDGSDEGRAGPSEGGSWTILHYSMADTDLEPFMIADVAEMGEVGTGDDLTLVALVDRFDGLTDEGVLGLDDWVGARTLLIGEGEAEVLEDHGDLNMGDPATLSRFLSEQIPAHPADNYALIISDHGGAWTGLGPDEGSGNDLLTLPELTAALEGGLDAAGVEKLGLIGFDACLMATYEVASAVAPFGERMVASEELEPGTGWDYTSLQSVHDRGGATADELGTVLVDTFKTHSEEAGQGSEVTLSLVDLTRMPALDAAVGAFGAALAERGQAVAPVVGRELSDNLAFGKSPDPEQNKFSTDLGLLATSIGTEALDVSDQADAVVKALNDMVVHKVAGPLTEGASGLAIHFPPRVEFVYPDYGSIPAAANWNGFLASYFGAGAAIAPSDQPRAVSEGSSAETFFDEDGFNIAGLFNSESLGNITDVVIDYGIVEEDGSVTYIGQEPAELADDGSGQALGIWDLTVLKMSDGEDEAYAYIALDYEDGDELATIDVPLAYYAEGDQDGETYQEVLLTLTFEVESGDIVSEVYYAYDEEAETYGELTADPEGIIVPEVLNVMPDGTEEWIPTSDVGLFADLPNIEYEFEPIESGTPLHADLTVIDYGGNFDSVSARVEVP